MIKKVLFIILFAAIAWVSNGQNYTIKGIVTDSITGEPLPYVAVLLKGTTIGGITDIDGQFTITTSSKARTIAVSYLGYTEKEVRFTPGKAGNMKVQLAPTSISLDEVVVKPGKDHYKKKDNPAVIFIKNAIERRESNDPRNHDYFQYDQYEKLVLAMNDYEAKPKKNGKPGKFEFLNDFVDTLEIGKTILPVSEREKITTVYYRKHPKTERRVVAGTKAAGVDEIFSRDGIQQLLNEVFWGDVMKTADPDVKPLASVSAGQYYEVSEDSPYHSIAAIKADAESVYTPEYAQTMYFMAFEGSDDIACRYKEENGVLLMNITYEPFDFGTEINIESARVKRTTADTAIVEVECVKNGESRLRELVLCSLDGVWLLDSPTY